jgi:RHS repeat-associated protein
VNKVFNPGSQIVMYYAYDAQNRRAWSWPGTADAYGNATDYTVNVYAPGGQKLGAYQIQPELMGLNIVLSVGLASSDQYFGSRRLAAMDQLGSVGNYFPWGEARSGDSQDTWNFATYWQDSVTGLDYAVNRYYSNAYGRFMTPDSGVGARPADPGSWNRYAYTRGDPVNRFDPSGRDDCAVIFADASQPYNPYSSCSGGYSCPDMASLEGDPDAATFYAQSAAIGCGSYSVSMIPVAAPAQPTISCSVSLYERPVIVNGVTVAEHTYIDLTVQISGVATVNFLCEGGPSNPNGSGTLQGGCVSAVNSIATKGPSGPGLPGNVQVGNTYTGADACDDVSEILGAVNLYQQNGVFAPYRPIIGPMSPYGYNSNSYSFTLLDDVGLAGYYPSGLPSSWFGWPPNTPGWGKVVPGL